MQQHSRGRAALAALLWVTCGSALAAAYDEPRIQSVAVMDDQDALIIMGENFPVRAAEMLVRLGPTDEPGNITRLCRISALSTGITCVFPGGLPPAGDYLLSVTNTRLGTGVSYALTIGAVGPRGAAGPQGPAGAPGTPGTIGPIGPAGAVGAAGPQGAPGPNGATGMIGMIGPIGPVGAVGAVGPQGIPGVVGPIGPMGPTGAAGPQGLTGATGPAGPVGPTGSQGIPGTPGSTGAVGATGATGATGAQGLIGPQGVQGIPGPPVSDARFGTDTSAAANGREYECVLGEVMLTAAGIAPGIRAEGQILAINTNTALFSLLGTRFGGNGQTTFALPDLRSAAPNGLTYVICTQGIFPSRI